MVARCHCPESAPGTVDACPLFFHQRAAGRPSVRTLERTPHLFRRARQQAHARLKAPFFVSPVSPDMIQVISQSPD